LREARDRLLWQPDAALFHTPYEKYTRKPVKVERRALQGSEGKCLHG